MCKHVGVCMARPVWLFRGASLIAASLIVIAYLALLFYAYLENLAVYPYLKAIAPVSYFVLVSLFFLYRPFTELLYAEMGWLYSAIFVSDREDEIDYGLIRDVLTHPSKYNKFLLRAYEEAFEDGIITDEERESLLATQLALGLSDEEAALIAIRASINSALRDGKVTETEMILIREAADRSELNEEEVQSIMDALEDGKIDDKEKEMLNDLLGEA